MAQADTSPAEGSRSHTSALACSPPDRPLPRTATLAAGMAASASTSESDASEAEPSQLTWDYFLPDFEYVVREQEKARVAFGSAQSRVVGPLAGLRAGASRLANLAVRATDTLVDLGPAAYTVANLGALYDTFNKVTSTRGVGPGARTAARFKEVDEHLPAPNAYQTVFGDPAPPCKVPFNTTTYRRPLVVSNTPGPGSYTPGAFSRPGVPVAVRCGEGEGPGHCESCLQDIALGVEFWALEASAAVQGLPRGAVLCQACMQQARRQLKEHPGGLAGSARFTRWQLDAFRKSRDCSDIHRHEGTKAKICLVDPKTVAKRRRKEAYLSRYFRDHVVVEPDFMPGTEPAKLTEAERTMHAGDGPDGVHGPRRRDDFCCLHEAFNSFNKDRMSFGLRVPSDHIYNLMAKCALDFHPSQSLQALQSVSSSLRSRPPFSLTSTTASASASPCSGSSTSHVGNK